MENENKKSTVTAFCAGEQIETEHTLVIDQNGEILLTCTHDLRSEEEKADEQSEERICGRFVKYPKDTDVATLKAEMAKHKFQNEGQLPIEKMEEKQAEFIDALNA